MKPPDLQLRTRRFAWNDPLDKPLNWFPTPPKKRQARDPIQSRLARQLRLLKYLLGAPGVGTSLTI